MKKFLKKITVLIILVGIFITLLLNNFGANIDPFYEKFTTHEQSSMIFGDSRAMQGIQPKVIDSCLENSTYKLPSFNFSFTIKQIEYGPSYLKSIKRKLDTLSHNQLFVITVNPWMLANRTPKSKMESDSILANMPPHNMRFMNFSPNVEYLVKNYSYFKFNTLFNNNYKLHKNGWSEFHLDGWLEENNFPQNKEAFLERKQSQIELYSNKAKKESVSQYRLNWLNKTIVYLQQYGKVVLVRMPIDKEILEIENKFWSHFDDEIKAISKNRKIDYFNFSTNIWSTYDGQHLDVYGSKKFTIKLSELIKNGE